jgi:hypothetical protein
MLSRLSLASVASLATFFQVFSGICVAQTTLAPLCQPTVTGPIIVDSHEQIVQGGERAQPPLTDTGGFGFAWPDTQMSAIKTASGYEFFASEGALHPRHMWEGHWVGNKKYGGVVSTAGTLGSGDPQDVSISPNPDPAVNPNYPSYAYLGGGSVYQVPTGAIGAGGLLVTYHAELPARQQHTTCRLRALWWPPYWTPRSDAPAHSAVSEVLPKQLASSTRDRGSIHGPQSERFV